MIHFELEKGRFIRWLNIISFGARQPVTISVKNGKLRAEHYIKRRNGYKILICKEEFFLDIAGECCFQLNTEKLLKEKQYWSGSKAKNVKVDILFEIIPNTDECCITTYETEKANGVWSSENRKQATQGFFPIQTIPEKYPYPTLRFQDGIPIFKRQKLNTHIKIKTEDLKKFSSCLNKKNVLEFELENDILTLHIKEDGNYYVVPDPEYKVENGSNLSITFDHFFKEAINHFETQFIDMYIKRKDYPVCWLCGKRKDYALGVLLVAD